MAIGDVLGLMGLGKNDSQDTSISELSAQSTASFLQHLRYFAGAVGRSAALFFLNNKLWRLRYTYLHMTDFTATYYVDAAASDDTGNGLTPATAWKTISKLNGLNNTTLVAGVRVLFKRGGVWREQFTVPNIKGTIGKPIIFGAYGEGAKPKISGGDIISGFSLVSSSYDAAVTTSPNVVYVNGTKGAKKASKAACTASGDWFWVGGTLSVYYASNPDGLVEAAQRAYGIMADLGRSDIVVDGLQFEFTNNSNLYMRTPNTLILNCEGTKIGDSNGYTNVLLYAKNQLVMDCYFHDHGGAGVQAGTDVTDSAIVGCTFKNLYAGAYPTGTGRGVILSGCKRTHVLCNNFNTCYLATNQTVDEDTHVAYNLVVGSKVDGINLQKGVAGHQRYVYNNTVIHTPAQNAGHGIDIQDIEPDTEAYTTIKNNLIYIHYTGAVGVVHGLWIEGANYVGVDVDYNLIFKSATSTNAYIGGIGGDNHLTFAGWKAAIGASAFAGKGVHDIGTDPLLVSTTVATADCHLQAGSPAIGVGVNVGYYSDYDGEIIAGVPAIGAYEYV